MDYNKTVLAALEKPIGPRSPLIVGYLRIASIGLGLQNERIPLKYFLYVNYRTETFRAYPYFFSRKDNKEGEMDILSILGIVLIVIIVIAIL